MKIRVYYEDTDAGGVVYHSNYLKFCERARSELFFELYPSIFEAKTGHFLLAKANCAFVKSAKLGDILEVKNKLLEVKNASVLLKQELFRGEEKIFSAEFVLVYVKESKPQVMSKELKETFVRLFSTQQS
ncbi:YbgC/FadM family acyl-CoA thioesterase [Campylobacter sp. MIT 19-121]|uniref:YbgC/FadM family acyl-CoA thioesterase n=1 Tax=Campylobacter sp. MIT 19-121 TaxID=2703906 RepID=UPI001389A2CA|nr:YbgC/FadM family acyl-CoA thioesterase [Campylobacter sp. MIT 19-121]NDJ26413.1 YbgC/FadM family acyl-CoA thioesterase [Campylobacter sp. MIT 19-121]